MLTRFMKGDAQVFLDIEASEGGPGDGESTDSNHDGMRPCQKYFYNVVNVV